MNKERDYFFDNLKAVLIFLVVLGHFLLPIHGESVLVVVKRLIYVFHMPLFVFVSGYFAKKIYKNGQYNFKKILYLIKAYIIFVIAIQIVYALCGFRDFSEINFFSQSGAPWYLFAMIVWYLTIPVIRKYKEIPVLIVTVALAQSPDISKISAIFCACPVFWYLVRSFIWDIIWNNRCLNGHCDRFTGELLYRLLWQSVREFWRLAQS